MTAVGKRAIASRSSSGRRARSSGPGKYDAAASCAGSVFPQRCVAAALALGACGTEGIQVAEDDPNYTGAVLFAERCSGCHTLDAAGAQGSANRELRNQGPNLDERVESVEDVLFAIRNGGFSGAIMPQNIVVGDEAQAVAEFVAEYAGAEVDRPTSPATRLGIAVATTRPTRRSSADRPERAAVLDLRAIRDDPGPAREALARRGAAEALDELLALDARRRELLPEVESRARRPERGLGRDRRGASARARTPPT